ncbi:MAG: hypothetical protein PHG20_12580, partial [Geobacteraceae bacterium]|nr:hypothetical protein [Geobacteraceae bacterium]
CMKWRMFSVSKGVRASFVLVINSCFSISPPDADLQGMNSKLFFEIKGEYYLNPSLRHGRCALLLIERSR